MGREDLGVLMVVLFVLVIFFSSVASPTLVQATEPAHLYDGPISVEVGDIVAPSSVIESPFCQTQRVRYKTVPPPIATVAGSVPILHDIIYTDGGYQCTIRNNQGLFTRNLYSGSNDPNNMWILSPSSSSVWLDPAPAGNNVLQLSVLRPGGTEYIVSLETDFTGNSGLRKGLFDVEWFYNAAASTTRTRLSYRDGGYFTATKHAFSPNGRHIVFKQDQRVVKVDLLTLEMTPVAYFPRNSVSDFAVSNDGRYVATKQADGLYMHDTAGCEQSYVTGEWTSTIQLSYPGCESSGNLVSRSADIRAGLGVDGNEILDYRQLKFTPNGAGLEMVLRHRSSSAPEFGDWVSYTLHADEYVPQAEGYIALGDSFSSGEGEQDADWYEPGTDEQGNKDTFENRNLCHLSRRSYPYLLAVEAGYLARSATDSSPPDSGLFHSVACSGARMHNIRGGRAPLKLDGGGERLFENTENQYRNDYLALLGRWQPGRVRQLDVFNPTVFGGYSQLEQSAEVITIGIGGNDANFGDILKACVLNPILTCQQAVPGSKSQADLQIAITQLKVELQQTYEQLKAANPDARIYVHGYPQFVDVGDSSVIDIVLNGHQCASNVALDRNERLMIIAGIAQMNRAVQAAAQAAGVFYVDVEDILNGVNLCSGAADEDMAFNGITSGNDISLVSFGGRPVCVFGSCVGNESFHPNAKAHRLYAEAISLQTDNFTAPMPTVRPTKLPLPNAAYSDDAYEYVSRVNAGEASDRVVPEPKSVFVDAGPGHIITGLDGLLAGSEVQVSMFSAPTILGEFTAADDGSFAQEVSIPDSVEPGVHEVHIKATKDTADEVDYYQYIYIGHSAEDFDGDGVLDVADSCQMIVNVGVDLDGDGVDDACDTHVVAQTLPDEDSPHVDDGMGAGVVQNGSVDRTSEGEVLGLSVFKNRQLVSAGQGVRLALFASVGLIGLVLIFFKRSRS